MADTRGSSVALSDLRARGVRVEWHETVAIVLELCRGIGDGPGPASGDLSAVLVHSGGTVSFVPGGRSDPATTIQRVGQILRASLPESGYPTPLRLLVSQAVSSPPAHESVSEFAAALQYYERPGRASLVDGVYVRWLTTPAPSPAEAVAAAQVPLRVKRKQEKEKKPAVPRKPGRGVGRLLLVGAGAAMVLALVGGAAWLVASGRFQPSQIQPPVLLVSLTERAVNGLSGVIRGGRGSGSAAGADVELPGPEPPARRPVPSNAASSAPASGAPAGDTGPAGSAAILAPDVTPSTTSTTPTVAATSEASSNSLESPAGSLVSPAAGTGLLPVAGSVQQTAETVYTDQDTGVVAPIAIYPQFPTALPPGVGPDEISVFEVVIDEQGRVESVRIQQMPKNLGAAITSTINMSAAKSWVFQPATKDGQPVKYRKLVWLAT
ncbi:MAG: hypothetical protein AB7F99_05485, partial [Vicinamibacterales bacterium]